MAGPLTDSRMFASLVNLIKRLSLTSKTDLILMLLKHIIAPGTLVSAIAFFSALAVAAIGTIVALPLGLPLIPTAVFSFLLGASGGAVISASAMLLIKKFLNSSSRALPGKNEDAFDNASLADAETFEQISRMIAQKAADIRASSRGLAQPSLLPPRAPSGDLAENSHLLDLARDTARSAQIEFIARKIIRHKNDDSVAIGVRKDRAIEELREVIPCVSSVEQLDNLQSRLKKPEIKDQFLGVHQSYAGRMFPDKLQTNHWRQVEESLESRRVELATLKS